MVESRDAPCLEALPCHWTGSSDFGPGPETGMAEILLANLTAPTLI